jgi:hypothetical protein
LVIVEIHCRIVRFEKGLRKPYLPSDQKANHPAVLQENRVQSAGKWPMMVLSLILSGHVDHGDRPAAGRVGELTGEFTAEGPVNAKTG